MNKKPQRKGDSLEQIAQLKRLYHIFIYDAFMCIHKYTPAETENISLTLSLSLTPCK